MARIAGVDIPRDRAVGVSLRHIYGVGIVLSHKALTMANVDPSIKTKDLTEEEINRINQIVEREFVVEGDLRRQVNMNIRRLMDIGSYRGLRHRRGLPVRGQRTRTNARSKRGSRKTVAGRRRATAKK